jgi:hypothetical protein
VRRQHLGNEEGDPLAGVHLRLLFHCKTYLILVGGTDETTLGPQAKFLKGNIVLNRQQFL